MAYGQWSAQNAIPSASSNFRPALAYPGSNAAYVIAAWTNSDGSGNIDYAVADENLNWHYMGAVPNVGTNAAPSLAVVNDTLYLAYHGYKTSDPIFVTTCDLSLPGVFSWSPVVAATAGAESAPCITPYCDGLAMVWLNDSNIYLATLDLENPSVGWVENGQALGPPNGAPFGSTGDQPMIVELYGCLYLTWQGYNEDAIYFSIQDPSTRNWRSQMTASASGVSTPAVTVAVGRIDYDANNNPVDTEVLFQINGTTKTATSGQISQSTMECTPDFSNMNFQGLGTAGAGGVTFTTSKGAAAVGTSAGLVIAWLGISPNSSTVFFSQLDGFQPYPRSDWMGWLGTNFPTGWQTSTLQNLCMPGAHDAGMYRLSPGQTQDQDVFGQLMGGVRYFDLRPLWSPRSNQFIIYHEKELLIGGTLSEILGDVLNFMKRPNCMETVVLKFSHYDGSITEDLFVQMAKQIATTLHGYLPATYSGKTLGTTPMPELAGKVLVVCDGTLPLTPGVPGGIFVYRDGCTSCGGETRNGNLSQANLTVWDCYSNTPVVAEMFEDQQLKFVQYNGKCTDGSDCDLFLLSWTLTQNPNQLTPSISTISYLASQANNLLLSTLPNWTIPSANGYRPNIVFVDYYEMADPTDLCMTFNIKHFKP